MLIAIMGDTFDRHNSNLHDSKIRQRLMVQAEFVWLVDFYMYVYEKILCCGLCRPKRKTGKLSLNEKIRQGYLFVVRPIDSINKSNGDGDGGGSASGSGSSHVGGDSNIGSDIMTKKFRDLDSLITKKVLRNIQDLSREVKERLDIIERAN